MNNANSLLQVRNALWVFQEEPRWGTKSIRATVRTRENHMKPFYENIVSQYQTLMSSLPRETTFRRWRPKAEFMTGPHRQPSKKPQKSNVNAMNLSQNSQYLWNIVFSRRSIWVSLELICRWTQHFTKIDQEKCKIEQICIWKPMITGFIM